MATTYARNAALQRSNTIARRSLSLNQQLGTNPLQASGMYAKGMYNSGMYAKATYTPGGTSIQGNYTSLHALDAHSGGDEEQVLEFIRHLMTCSSNIQLPDSDYRPSQAIRSNVTLSYIVAPNSWDKGCVLMKPRLDGGNAWIGRLVLTDGALVGTATGTPIFCPNKALPFTPDPSSDFKNVRPTGLVVGVASKTTSTTSASLSGTVNGVAFGDFNDLTTTDLSTFATVAYTDKDYMTSSPIFDGIVMVAGPDMITGYTQPRSVGPNEPGSVADTPISMRDGAELVVCMNSVTTNIPAGGNSLLGGLSVVGPVTRAGAVTGGQFVTNQSRLPNDLLDVKIRITLTATFTPAGSDVIGFTVRGLCGLCSDAGAPSTTEIVLLTTSSGPTSITPTTVSASSTLYLADFSLLRLNVLSTSNTALTMSKMSVTVSVQGYYDRINGPTYLTQWNNVGTGQEIVIEGKRRQQGVSSGSLTQYLKTMDRGTGMTSPGEIQLASRLFADPKVQWIRRIYTQSSYQMVVQSNSFSITEMKGHLQAAGAFETLGHFLGSLGSSIPIIGPFLSGGLRLIGGFADNAIHGILNSATHPGTKYQHTLGTPVQPSGQRDIDVMTEGTYTKPSSTMFRWAHFPSVCGVTNEIYISKVVISSNPITSKGLEGELRQTVYIPTTVVCADGNSRTYFVSRNLTEENNSLLQAVELLGTLIPGDMYVTDPLMTSTSGASYGLAMAAAILGLPNHWVMTGVVKVSDDFELRVYPVDFAQEKAQGVLSKGRRLICPVASIPQDYAEEVTTPIDLVAGFPPDHIVAVHAVTDLFLIPDGAARTKKPLAPRTFQIIRDMIPMAASDEEDYGEMREHARARILSTANHVPKVYRTNPPRQVGFPPSVEKQLQETYPGLQPPLYNLTPPLYPTLEVEEMNLSSDQLDQIEYVDGAPGQGYPVHVSKGPTSKPTRKLKSREYKLGEVLKDFVLFPTVQRSEADTIKASLFAVIPGDASKPVVNAMTNPTGKTGGRLVRAAIRQLEGKTVAVYDGETVVGGRSWEYAFMMLYTDRRSDITSAYSGEIGVLPDGSYIPKPPAFRQQKSSFLGSIKIKLIARTAEYGHCNICGSNCATTSGPALVCSECSNATLLPEMPMAASYGAEDTASVERRMMGDLATLAARSSRWAKMQDIHEFLEVTDTEDLFWQYVQKNTVRVGENEFEFNGGSWTNALTNLMAPYNAGIVPRTVRKAETKREAISTMSPEVSAVVGANYGNASAVAAKAKRIADAMSSAGTVVTVDWVLKNGNRGLSAAQMKYHKTTGKLPPPGDDPTDLPTSAQTSVSRASKIAINAFNTPTPEQVQMVSQYLESHGGKGPDQATLQSWSGRAAKPKVKIAPKIVVRTGSRFRAPEPQGEEGDLV